MLDYNSIFKKNITEGFIKDVEGSIFAKTNISDGSLVLDDIKDSIDEMKKIFSKPKIIIIIDENYYEDFKKSIRSGLENITRDRGIEQIFGITVYVKPLHQVFFFSKLLYNNYKADKIITITRGEMFITEKKSFKKIINSLQIKPYGKYTNMR